MQNYINVNCVSKDTVASPAKLFFLGPAPICLDEKTAALKATDGEEKKKRLTYQQLPACVLAKQQHHNLTSLHVLASRAKAVPSQTLL